MTDPEYVFTIAISQAEAEALAREEVPPAVRDTVISLLIDVRATPGEAVEAMARRRKHDGTGEMKGGINGIRISAETRRSR